jgi:hypothetical protein
VAFGALSCDTANDSIPVAIETPRGLLLVAGRDRLCSAYRNGQAIVRPRADDSSGRGNRPTAHGVGGAGDADTYTSGQHNRSLPAHIPITP